MLRRIAALTVFAAISLVGVSAVFAWYQQLQSVPTMSNYTIPCEQDATAAWCGSLHRIFSVGRGSSGRWRRALLVAGLTLVALVLLRLARQRWLAAGACRAIAGLAGNGSALGLAAGAGGVLQPLAVPRPLSC